jgi:hypothetical protein
MSKINLSGFVCGRIIEELSNNDEETVEATATGSQWFSLVNDEITFVSDTSQLVFCFYLTNWLEILYKASERGRSMCGFPQESDRVKG